MYNIKNKTKQTNKKKNQKHNGTQKIEKSIVGSVQCQVSLVLAFTFSPSLQLSLNAIFLLDFNLLHLPLLECFTYLIFT